jgi:predicted membrane protein
MFSDSDGTQMMWSWVLSTLGILGFIYAGRHQWWAWLWLAANELLWIIYAITTHQYGFILGAIGYITIHTLNAHKWRTQ